jgi:hypothetical protein
MTDGARWPLASVTARLLWLRSLCAVAEGADVPLSHTARRASSSSRCPPDVCVAAVLGDDEHRVAVLGGREGMPRSLGSVYGGAVTRFLGGSLRGVESRVIGTPGVMSQYTGVAVSVDGTTLLLSDMDGGSHAIHTFSVADGSRLRVVGGFGNGELRFKQPSQVWVADDGFVFVADSGNDRVQVLTPALDFHEFFGEGELDWPTGVCANADIRVVVASEYHGCCISVFNRRNGALRRRFACKGSRDGRLRDPCGLCFLSGDRRIAVADSCNNRVSVFSVDGEFIRHVGVGILSMPVGVTATAFDELVVSDCSRILPVFSAVGDVLVKLRCRQMSTGVAIHGSTLFVPRFDASVPWCTLLI